MQRVPCRHYCRRGSLYRMQLSKHLPARSLRDPDRNVFPRANDGTGIPVSRAYCGSYRGAYGSSHCSAYCYSYSGTYCHSSGDSGCPCAEPGSISIL